MCYLKNYLPEDKIRHEKNQIVGGHRTDRKVKNQCQQKRDKSVYAGKYPSYHKASFFVEVNLK